MHAETVRLTRSSSVHRKHLSLLLAMKLNTFRNFIYDAFDVGVQVKVIRFGLWYWIIVRLPQQPNWKWLQIVHDSVYGLWIPVILWMVSMRQLWIVSNSMLLRALSSNVEYRSQSIDENVENGSMQILDCKVGSHVKRTPHTEECLLDYSIVLFSQGLYTKKCLKSLL